MNSHPIPSNIRTALTDLFQIRYPIVLAGMGGGVTTPQLVSAVSNAGGLGVLGANGVPPEQLQIQIRTIKSMTSKPFGVNFLLSHIEKYGNKNALEVESVLNKLRLEIQIPPKASPDYDNEIPKPDTSLQDQLDVVFEERVPIIAFGLGDPSKYVQECHELGIKVTAMVTSVKEAIQVADSGVDAIVAQGSEAGGHRSTFELDENGNGIQIGTMALIPQVVDAVRDRPVIAAGGIMDGRGIVASLALGARGVQLGTRFLVAVESGVFHAYKRKLLASSETDTVVTKALTGRPARAIKNRIVTMFDKPSIIPLPWPIQDMEADDIYMAAKKIDNPDYAPLYAGQGLRLLKDRQSAAKIIEELVTETNEAKDRLQNL
ncbi:MAG: nitronate monooxygenase [Thermoproteota archaeon]|nr:nitronate monooxygenase [Thermoproteota archaeon]